jgi:hypothetical protein
MSTETVALPNEAPRRFQLGWVLPALFSPRKTFTRVAEQTGDVWLTPLLVIMAFALLGVIVAGPLKQAAAQNGQSLPPDFQFWSPEQQAQFMQAQAATSGPVFVYVFPAILSMLTIWVRWLLVAGLLHLVLTLLGGRGSARVAMNLVAWANLPFAVREAVAIGAMLTTRQLVNGAGLSGFAPTEGALGAFLASLLGLVDIYLGWHIALLGLGVHAGNGLSRGKAVGGVLLTMAIVLVLQALPGFILAQLEGLSFVRPFFF